MAESRQIPQNTRIPWLIVLGAACWASALTLAVMVATSFGPLASSDRVIGSWIYLGVSDHAAWLGYTALVWHYVIGPTGSTLAAVVATTVLLLKHRNGWALYMVSCSIGGLIVAESIKNVLERQRPVYPDRLVLETGGSFPSGHAMAGIYVWAVIGLILLYLVPGRLGTILGWVFIVFGVLAAPSRLLLGVHWPSDVIGGWMLALGWVLLVSAVAIGIANRRAARMAATTSVTAATVDPPGSLSTADPPGPPATLHLTPWWFPGRFDLGRPPLRVLSQGVVETLEVRPGVR